MRSDTGRPRRAIREHFRIVRTAAARVGLTQEAQQITAPHSHLHHPLHPHRRSHASGDASMERRVRPVNGRLQPAMLHRVEVNWGRKPGTDHGFPVADDSRVVMLGLLRQPNLFGFAGPANWPDKRPALHEAPQTRLTSAAGHRSGKSENGAARRRGRTSPPYAPCAR